MSERQPPPCFFFKLKGGFEWSPSKTRKRIDILKTFCFSEVWFWGPSYLVLAVLLHILPLIR